MQSAGGGVALGIALIDEAAMLAAFRRSAVFSPLSPPLDSIIIYLSLPSAASVFPMQVLESDSIASVKLRIQCSRGFGLAKQRLVFGGRELARNDCLVSDYGVGDGGVLHLVLRLSDVCRINVRTACGKKLNLSIQRCRTISYLKQRIAERRGADFTDLSDYRLVYEGEELADHSLISDICNYKDADLHFLFLTSAKVCTKPVEKGFQLSIVASRTNQNIKNLQLTPLKTSYVEPVFMNQNVDFSPVIEDLIRDTLAGLEKGNLPVMSTEGSGGAYFMHDESGTKYVAVFKPIDEEPLALNNPQGLPPSSNGEGLKRGTRVGEGALREVAAYILDHPLNGPRPFLCDDAGFSGVPPTVMVQCLNGGFNHPYGYENRAKYLKVGSLQMFVKNNGSCEDMGPRAFPVEEVHKICVLDLRLANADRHAGNILVCKEGDEGSISLVPIDHGYCLPENFEDCAFEWLYWPQSRQPFNSQTVDYIRVLDAEQDIALLKFHGWDLPLESARTLRISTMLLKKGAERGFTPYAIGSILCRETLNKKSRIEKIIQEANDDVLPGASEAMFMEAISKIMDRHLDELTI